MARQGHEQLARHGAIVKLARYRGGHGWRGNVYADIRKGIHWLESPVRQTHVEPRSSSFLLRDGFEAGRRGPLGWVQGRRVPGARLAWDKEVAFEGKASLRLEKKVKKYWPIAQWSRTIRCRAGGRQLRVMLQVKAQNVTKAVVDVQFLGRGGRQLGHKWAIYIGSRKAGDRLADHDWQEYSGVVSVPAGVQLVRVALQIYGPGTVWFDDLRVSYMEAESDASKGQSPKRQR